MIDRKSFSSFMKSFHRTTVSGGVGVGKIVGDPSQNEA